MITSEQTQSRLRAEIATLELKVRKALLVSTLRNLQDGRVRVEALEQANHNSSVRTTFVATQEPQ